MFPNQTKPSLEEAFLNLVPLLPSKTLISPIFQVRLYRLVLMLLLDSMPSHQKNRVLELQFLILNSSVFIQVLSLYSRCLLSQHHIGSDLVRDNRKSEPQLLY